MISRERDWWRKRMVSATADRKRCMAQARLMRGALGDGRFGRPLPERVSFWVHQAREANRRWLDARRNLRACEVDPSARRRATTFEPAE